MSATKPIFWGINKAYFAKKTVSNGAVTYDTPTRLLGARNLSMNPEGGSEDFHADNGVYFTGTKNNGRSGTLELAGLTDSNRVLLLNDVIDANGVCLEDANAVPAEGALLFEVDNDTAYPTRYVLYDVKFSRPSEEHATTEDNVSPGTISLDYRAIPIELPWGTNESILVVGGHLDYADSPAAIGTAYNAWYTTVQKPAKPSA